MASSDQDLAMDRPLKSPDRAAVYALALTAAMMQQNQLQTAPPSLASFETHMDAPLYHRKVTLGSVCLSLLCVFLWLVVICCVACFLVITFMQPTNWYTDNQSFVSIRGDVTLGLRNVQIATTTVSQNGTLVPVQIGKDTPLWNGKNAFPVTLQIGSVMIAALAVAALKYLQAVIKAQSNSSLVPTRGAWGTALLKLRLLLAHPLQPTRFWNGLCGGMSVLDALLMAIWCSLTILYLYFEIMRAFAHIASRMPPPVAPPAFSPPPASDSPLRNSVVAPPAASPDTTSALFAYQRFEVVGKILGHITRFQLMLMFMPISRSHFLKWVFGTDFQVLIKYHRWMAWQTVLTIFIHSVMYMALWGAEGILDTTIGVDTQLKRRKVMGLIATSASLVMAFTATEWFRRTYHWIFYKVHVTGFVIFTLFAVMHNKGLANWILPGLCLYGVDRAFRYWQLATNWTCITFHDFSVNGNVLTLRLTMEKGTSISSKPPMPGQTVYLRCPSISLFQSHPFSVADVASETASNRLYLTLHLAVKGPWTSALRTRLLSGESVSLQVEGPYETTLDNPPTTQVVVMVAGGLGVTPILALLRQYYRRALGFIEPMYAPKVVFIWSSRRLADFKLLGTELLSAASASSTGKGGKSAPKTMPGYLTPLPSRHRNCYDDVSPDQTGTPPIKTAMYSRPSFSSLESVTNSPFSTARNSYVGHAADKPRMPAWLNMSLNYTGLELEEKAQREGAVKIDLSAHLKADTKPVSTSLCPETDAGQGLPQVHPSVPLLAVPPLKAHPAGNPLLYSLCILAGFFGGWAGLLGANWYEAYYSMTRAQGPHYQGVGALQWSLIALGAVCTPLIVLTLHSLVYRCFSFPTAASYADTGAHTGAFASLQRTLTVLPGYVLAPTQPSKAPAFDTQMGITRGRPTVLSKLKQVKRDHSDQHEVEVLVGGGDELCNTVQAACVACNADTSTPGPIMVFRRVAHFC